MRLIFLSVVLTISTTAFAQRTLKLYNNLDYVRTYHHLNGGREMKLSFERFSIGYQLLNPKRLLHELEFSFSPSGMPVDHVRAENDLLDTRQIYGSFLYEMQKPFYDFRKLREQGFKFSVGAGVQFYYAGHYFDPIEPKATRHRYHNIGMTILFIPRIQYVINHHFSIDLNAKFATFTLREIIQVHKFTNIPIRNKRVEDFQTEVVQQDYNVRIGLGYTF